MLNFNNKVIYTKLTHLNIRIITKLNLIKMSAFNDTELTTFIGYDTNRMIFNKPVTTKLESPPITFQRIYIGTKNLNGTIGELIVETPPRLFSFGVAECKNDRQEVTGYNFPLVLTTKDAVTKEQEEFIEFFNKISERCKKHLIDERKTICRHDLEYAELKKFNPVKVYKKDGTPYKTGPCLYPKLIQSKKDSKSDQDVRFRTVFRDAVTGEEVNPLDLIGKYCNSKSAIKIESIFIGKDISLQIKVYEAEVELINTKSKSLLFANSTYSKLGASTPLISESGNSSASSMLQGTPEDIDDDSSSDSDGDQKPSLLTKSAPGLTQAPPTKPTVVKKTITRTTVKK